MTIGRTGALIIGGSLVAIGGLACALWWMDRPDFGVGDEDEVLTVWCAAGVREPLEAVVAEYEAECGVDVVLDGSMSSGSLVAKVRVASRAVDLFVAGDGSFVDRAAAYGCVAERMPVAHLVPVLAVPRDGRRIVTSLDDLLRDDVRVGLGDPETTAVGKTSRALLTARGQWEPVWSRRHMSAPDVESLATAVGLGHLDAALVWETTALHTDGVDIVPCDGDAFAQTITAAVVAETPRPTRALHFLRFLTARDRGAELFEAKGFRPVPGDPWVERPRIELLCGAMLQPAVDERIRAFARREGVDVACIYDGCGILVSLMKTGTPVDAYFSCDQSFLDLVAPDFEEGVVISSNRMVLAVPAGNPQSIRRPEDLLRDGLRVGVAHPEHSALGALTRRYLQARDLEGRLRRDGRIVLEQPKGDLLIANLRAGSLDVAIVYESNVAESGEALEAVRLDGEDAVATQPFAVSSASRSPALCRRLLDAVAGHGARERFESLGFQWSLEDDG